MLQQPPIIVNIFNPIEFTGCTMGPGAGRGRWSEQRRTWRQGRFETLDGDNDGKLSQTEFMAAGKQRYTTSDLDDDGVVTVWEFRSQRRSWQ